MSEKNWDENRLRKEENINCEGYDIRLICREMTEEHTRKGELQPRLTRRYLLFPEIAFSIFS